MATAGSMLGVSTAAVVVLGTISVLVVVATIATKTVRKRGNSGRTSVHTLVRVVIATRSTVRSTATVVVSLCMDLRLDWR